MSTSISQELKEEIDRLAKKDIDAFEEGWTNQSLAWQYNYSFKIFKDTFKGWIAMHSFIVDNKRPLTVAEVSAREEQMGIVMPKISNPMS